MCAFLGHFQKRLNSRRRQRPSGRYFFNSTRGVRPRGPCMLLVQNCVTSPFYRRLQPIRDLARRREIIKRLAYPVRVGLVRTAVGLSMDDRGDQRHHAHEQHRRFFNPM
jgi:hypothetical protein